MDFLAGRKLWTRLLAALILCFLITGAADARSRRKRNREKQDSGGDFAYYMLVLSYAPDFCDQPSGNKDPRECGTGRHVGYVVHGMWPQGENSRGPEHCGGSPVSQDIVRAMLNYIPTEGLIQHEWTNHGTCSGLSAADYFAAVRKARDAVKIPSDLNQPSRQQQLNPGDVAAKFAAANPRYPKTAFRVTCYQNGELQEVRICLNKDLTPRDCGSSAGGCSRDSVTVLPVR